MHISSARSHLSSCTSIFHSLSCTIFTLAYAVLLSKIIRTGLLKCLFRLPPFLLCLQQLVLIRKFSLTVLPCDFLVWSLLRILASSASLSLRSRMCALIYTLVLSLLDGFKSCKLIWTLLHLWRCGLLWVTTIHSSTDHRNSAAALRVETVCREEGNRVEWEMWIHALILQQPFWVALNISLTSFLPLLCFLVLQSPTCKIMMVKLPATLPLP